MDETPTDTTHRSEPPQQGDETATLLGFLEYLRATVAWKTEGLSTAQLHERPLPSTMTLGGMLRHLTYVEDHWFCYVLSGQRQCSPWDAVEWEKDPDWDWDSASEAGGDALRTHWAAAVEQSRQRWENFAAEHAHPMDALVARPLRGDMNARWVLTHMVEEYARHCGHADLLREAIDGAVGE
ncbi:MAG: DinB family protein [Kocuria sp.]|uniref:DinB family protein n=1 Tax=Kocuria TaxID=57493 RepID=UPI001EB2D4A7|nr:MULTISPECIES: DinB family protein [unclassified Kocuria]MBS6031308.1 DinB family protein [Kocuria rhizophila]MDO4255894.1 DinB family protein [Kocuria sp.]